MPTMIVAGWILPLFLCQASRAAALNVTRNYTTTVLEFSYQSKGIQFAEWISLFTLCLAPLIAHIVSGVPEPVYLSSQRPKWHHRICLFNPTTILWRYFAIADRRIRAKAWNAANMAASNAYFWTSRGWDGSEDMVGRSRAFSIKLPDSSRATLLSESSAKSVIVTLQGVQALYSMVSGVGGLRFSGTIAIDSIFFPLAVFGLLRLSAAFWLTGDYSYAEDDVPKTSDSSKLDVSASRMVAPFTEARPMDSMGLLDPSDHSSEEYFRPINSWCGRLFRAVYLLPILGLWIICVLYLLPLAHENSFTTTTFLLSLFYLFFLTASILIYTYYFIRELSATTIIPCVTSTWYKIYTCVLFVFILALIVLAALETRKTPCGKYTTWPSLGGAIDAQICEGLIPVSANSTQVPFGIASWNAGSSNEPLLKGAELVIVDFDGFCQGITGASQVVVPANGSTNAA